MAVRSQMSALAVGVLRTRDYAPVAPDFARLDNEHLSLGKQIVALLRSLGQKYPALSTGS